MMTSIRRYKPLRTLVRTVLILAALSVPFIRVKGESAFRFDIPSLTLYVVGSRIAMDEFFIVLISILFLSFLIILLTILFGRIWCGWLCPQTVITDATRFIDKSAQNGASRRIGAAAVLLPLSMLLAADILWYFVSPYDFIQQMQSRQMPAVTGWSWTILTMITFLNFLFLRRGFCATVCPYAKMQSVLYDDQTLIISMDPERRSECMQCDACVRTCPVGIDVRKGIQTACINCAECIDACADRMERRKKTSLIGYQFGEGRDKLSLGRKGVLFSAAGTCLFLVLLLSLVHSRSNIEMMVLPDTRSVPRLSADGNLVNLYVLAVTNRTDKDASLSVHAKGEQGELVVLPDRIQVSKNGHERFTVTVKSVNGPGQKGGPEYINIWVISVSDKDQYAQQRVRIYAPR